VPDYLPHTEAETAEMLRFLGLGSLEELHAQVPAAIRLSGGLDLPTGRSEPDVAAMFDRWIAANRATTSQLTCFAGAGAYDHEVPAVVRALAGRSEFVTAYTPYQPEVAQGVLQAIFEYQTMVSRLSGLPISNASLYDGASALVEGVNMAVGATGHQRLLISAGVHPHWRAVVRTFARGTGHEVLEVPLVDGVTDWGSVAPGEAGAVVAAYPNFLGVIEDLSPARELATRSGALLVVAADPVGASVLRTAGQWGADVMVGEGQPFGTPLAFGGPYLGLFACTQAQVRRLPGRLVGETVDTRGRRAFVTTLRAREQDIRREKATSNVCTNQTLMAVTAAVQLGWLGTHGLREVATRCAQGAHYAFDLLTAIDGVVPVSSAPFLREFTVSTTLPATTVLARLVDQGFLGGVSVRQLTGGPDGALADDRLDGAVVVAVTERRTRSEIDQFASAFAKALR
jgi:glycine dehydrogenase subunit 1